jgi:spore coat protein SA
MKILMICTEKLPIPPVLGGAIQTYIAGILPHLSKSHEVTVLGISDTSLKDNETINEVHFARVPGKIFNLYREGVVQYVEKNHFDLIHIFNRPRLVLPVRQAAPQAKITLSMHNDMFNPDKIDEEEALAVLEQVSSIVTVSEYVGNVIRNLYPQASHKLRTIYSGVDTDRFMPGTAPKMQKIRNEYRKAHGLENKTVILFAGRLSHNKGVDRLVRALPELSKKYKDLALVIVGSKWFSQNSVTDYITYVKALANKLTIPVVSTGFVDPSEIQNWFAAADLFVCTSLWQEPLARVHYEAMSAGLPIVTTARGGNAEVIIPGENGLIVDNPEDPACFAEKITEILSSKTTMKRMGERGRQLAVTHYEWNRVAGEVADVWEQARQMSAPVAQNDAVETENELIELTFDTESLQNQTKNMPAAAAIQHDAIETEKEPHVVISDIESLKKLESELEPHLKENRISKSLLDLGIANDMNESQLIWNRNSLSKIKSNHRSRKDIRKNAIQETETKETINASTNETSQDLMRLTIRNSIRASLRESLKDSLGGIRKAGNS